MIKSVTVINAKDEQLEMELANAISSGFQITSITGIGPTKADINTTNVSTFDGSIFNSAKILERNIILKISYIQTETETIEDIRQKSYKYFPVKGEIKLLFKTDNRELIISGIVESNEINIFAQKEGSIISIICPDPYFYTKDEDVETTPFGGIESVFQFPFSNEISIVPTKNIILSNISSTPIKSVYYNGDSEVGIKLIMRAYGTVGDITVYDLLKNESMKIIVSRIADITGSGIIDGDTITINTISGSKSVTLLRNAVEYNILNSLDKKAKWFRLSNGENTFAYTAESGIENIQAVIENNVKYEGV